MGVDLFRPWRRDVLTHGRGSVQATEEGCSPAFIASMKNCKEALEAPYAALNSEHQADADAKAKAKAKSSTKLEPKCLESCSSMQGRAEA